MEEVCAFSKELGFVPTESKSRESKKEEPSIVSELQRYLHLHERFIRTQKEYTCRSVDKHTFDLVQDDFLKQKIAYIRDLNTYMSSILDNQKSILAVLQHGFVGDSVCVDPVHQRVLQELVTSVYSEVKTSKERLEKATNVQLQQKQTTLHKTLGELQQIQATFSRYFEALQQMRATMRTMHAENTTGDKHQ